MKPTKALTILLLSWTAFALGGCKERPPQPAARSEPVTAVESGETAPIRRPLPSEPSAGALQRGQLLYVPVYSSIYTKGAKWPTELATTLSVRNTAVKTAIELERVDYFDSKGKPLQSFLAKPVRLDALETRDFVVKEDDQRGGPGANFLVEWRAERAVTPPLVETVNVFSGTSSGFAFTSRARVLRND